MLKVYSALLTLVLSSFYASALVRPADNDTVNYRLVGFSVNAQSDATSYVLEVAKGTINNNTDFAKSITIKQSSNKNRIIATVPEFGKSYTWRVTYLNIRMAKAKARHNYITSLQEQHRLSIHQNTN